MTPGNWDKANAANDFVSMVYMRKDGTGLMHTTESGEVEAITMDDLHPYAVEVKMCIRDSFGRDFLPRHLFLHQTGSHPF